VILPDIFFKFIFRIDLPTEIIKNMKIIAPGLISLILYILCVGCKAPSTAPDSFVIDPAFNLSMVAAEPLIKDPVDLEFDEHGDAYVLEMPGYPFEDKQSRVILLKDKNQDGIYDEGKVYAENLQLGASILCYRQGMLVAAPPYLLNLHDTNHDEVIDKIDTVMGGFSTGNLQHNYNGLTYGNDGWIYAANGGNSGKPYWWGDTTSRIDLRGQDLRFNLNTKTMERLGASSGGFGITMDEGGQLFGTHNTRHISQLVFPGRYTSSLSIPWEKSLTNISDHEEDGLARIYPVGEQESRVNHPEQSGYFSGSCGLTYYGGNAFGDSFNHTIWVADVVLNLIHVDRLKKQGSLYTASRVYEKKEILASTDRAFRPVNMTVGPDGAMYVVDMYRKVIEHPEWIPDEMEKTMDLNAGKDKGRIYKIDGINHPYAKIDFKTLESVEGQIRNLSHPNQWVRKTAQRLLQDQSLNEGQVKLLSDLLASQDENARLHALYLLSIKEKLSSVHLLSSLMDASPTIRENALKIAEPSINGSKEVLNKCIGLLQDPDQRVRMQAALSLSTCTKAVFLENKEELFHAILATAQLPMDKWNMYACAIAAKYDPMDLFNRISSATPNENSIPFLKTLAWYAGSTTDGFLKLLNALNTMKASPVEKTNILIESYKNLIPSVMGTALLPQINHLEQTVDINLLACLGELRKKLKLPQSAALLKISNQALSIVLNNALSDSVRLKQMSLINLMPYKEKADVLFKCIDNKQPLSLQDAALKQLQQSNDPEIGPRIVQAWSLMGPQARREGGDILLYKKTNQSALLDGLEQKKINIGEMNFELERRRTLLWWSDNDSIKKRAEALFSDVGVVTRKDALEKMKPALALHGNTDNGQKVFIAVCSQCHLYGSTGNEVGPVLTEISRKSKETLMQDILDPNAATDTKYISHKIELKNGDIHIGIVDAETDQSVTIKKMGGSKVTISKPEIKEFTSLGKSLMMEGLEGNMTTQQMADLLAYLQKGK
jgi:putative membrane-bound dehydrogenase-like protein